MKRDVSLLAGPQKAAALLLAMGKPAATQLLKHFTHQELREVTAAAARLGTVQNAELDAIVDDFTAAFSAGVPLLGDEGQTRALLADAVPAGPDRRHAVRGAGRPRPRHLEIDRQSARGAALQLPEGRAPADGDLHSLQARRRAFRARGRAAAARAAQSGSVPAAVAADRRAGRARPLRDGDAANPCSAAPPTRAARTTACASPKSSTAWTRPKPRTS